MITKLRPKEMDLSNSYSFFNVNPLNNFILFAVIKLNWRFRK